MHALMLPSSFLWPAVQLKAKWIKGTTDGEKKITCDQVCQQEGLVCDASAQSALTSQTALDAAFKQAGYTCKGFHGPRNYAGTPFSTGRDGDDCAPLMSGAQSVCDDNFLARHAPLCYCRRMFGCE